jgi:GTP-binding protein Era
VGAAWEGAAEADVLLVLVDALKGMDEHVRSVLAGLNANTPTCLVLTKVDALKDKEKLLLLAQELTALYAFDEVFMVSAEKDSGIQGLEAYLLSQAKPGPWFYPPDQLMDINERLFAAEITREHLFLQLRQELPYSLTVETEKWEEHLSKGEKQGDVKIWQVIVVERESHKKIILGEKGSGIKRLGESARHQLGRLLGRTVHLFLHVKVREDWKNKAEHYQALGLNFDS